MLFDMMNIKFKFLSNINFIEKGGNYFLILLIVDKVLMDIMY